MHVLNRSPTVVVKDMTLEEAWIGIKPNVDYFRIFGCIGHVHVLEGKRKKLDDKSFQCVLLRMSEESKAYRLYDPLSKKIIVIIHVIFEENKCWKYPKHVLLIHRSLTSWRKSLKLKYTSTLIFIVFNLSQ